jgi:hypothetical protein
MELFDQLDLPEEAVPGGPVNLVEAVLPYVSDESQHQSISKQLEAFRGDQTEYKEQAEKTAQEWMEFEVELARSLQNEMATDDIRQFIIGLQEVWSEANLDIINSHSLDNGEWRMTRRLAASLEDSKRQILTSFAGLKTGNEDMIRQVKANKLENILEGQRYLDMLRVSGVSQDDINMVQMELQVKIARENISVSGGCPGQSANNFGGPPEGSESLDKKDWKWKKGRCVIKTCPSPNPTEVGPCSVCRKCQNKFDKGEDPTKQSLSTKAILNGVSKVIVKRQESTPELSLVA